MNTFNTEENLDNNQEICQNSKTHVTIEFQLNKEEKNAEIIKRKISNMSSQNSFNKQEITSNFYL